MAIAVINDFDAKLFELNDIKYVRNFQAIKIGDTVRISNAYDSRFTLAVAHYSEYIVNGTTYTDSNSLVSNLSSILFVKDEVTSVTGESSNDVSEAKFYNKDGVWINSPSNPLTTPTINLNLTSSKNGAVSPVYYKGNVLNKTDFVGGTVVFMSGENRLNVLCTVWIVYDKGTGAFHVNIVDTFTGDIPVAPTDAPAQMTITAMIDETGGEDAEIPAQMAITEVLLVADIVDPETMAITEIVAPT